MSEACRGKVGDFVMMLREPPGAPAGVYTLYVGAYRRNNQRMPVAPVALSDGRDRLRLLTITVAR